MTYSVFNKTNGSALMLSSDDVRKATRTDASTTTVTMEDGVTYTIDETPTDMQTALASGIILTSAIAPVGAAILVNTQNITRADRVSGSATTVNIGPGNSISVSETPAEIAALL